jgi:hypothetical protein
MKQFSASNHTKQYLRDLLEFAKQRMLSGIPTNVTNETNVTSSQQLSTSSSSSHAIEQLLMNANIVETVIGVGYVFIIVAFLVKLFLKTLRRFESHFGSSHDGTYNRFGFIANEESDFDSSDNDSDGENNFDDDVVESSSSSPVSQRHALIPLVTPLQKITTVTPQTPSPPPVRRSLRLKIKSELNLTSTMEKQNKTNTNTNVVVVTRSQTRRRNQSQNQNHVTHKPFAISSEPAPSSSFNRSHDGSVTNPSLHPENDEELAYYLQRCYERNMKKRSDVNSPLLVRRLVL